MTVESDPVIETPVTTTLDADVSTFITDLEAEYRAEAVATPAEPVAETPGPTADTPPPEPEAPAVERGLERLVTREVELRTREDKVAGAEKEVAALRARLSELETRAISPDVLDKIRISPAEGLRALGLDPDEIVRTALMEKIGDKATPEMREMLEKSQIRRELSALKAEMQAAQYQRTSQELYIKVSNGANQFVQNNEGISKHAPTVAAVAKSNPDRVYQEIMGEITMDAQVRSAKGDPGDLLSYEEAAKRVETRWSSMKALFGAGIPPVTTSSSEASTSPPKTSVSPAVASPKPSPTTIKPPEKPIAPWLQRQADEEDAVQAAILEWKRSESANR